MLWFVTGSGEWGDCSSNFVLVQTELSGFFIFVAKPYNHELFICEVFSCTHFIIIDLSRTQEEVYNTIISQCGPETSQSWQHQNMINSIFCPFIKKNNNKLIVFIFFFVSK